MAWFSWSSPATPMTPCVANCKARRAEDDRLSHVTALRMATLTGAQVPEHAGPGVPCPGVAPGAGDCARQAATLAPVMQRFNRYRQVLPAARAVADMNELEDDAGEAPSTQPCLVRLPVSASRLGAALGLPPGGLANTDVRNDETGFRVALYRDEASGRLILVPRDTEPDSLVDWQTNTRNGSGIDTPQYRAMRTLTSKLATSGQVFDIAGYSKGGGLAQEGGLLSRASSVTIFNSAGLPDNALGWTGQSDFSSLTARTAAFNSEDDLVTYMNDATDPGQRILNARFLRNELAGEAPGLNPIAIKVRNPALRGKDDEAFAADKKRYLSELDSQIVGMQSAYDTGGVVPSFPPLRSATRETIVDSLASAGKLLGAQRDQPSLGKLAQHKIGAVLDPLEADVAADRKTLQRFIATCA